MRKLILFGLFFIFCNSVYSQTTEFFEKMISNVKCRNCYLIPVSVRSNTFSGKVVVENYWLFNYLKSVKGLDEETYKSIMLKSFQNNEPIQMNDLSVDESGSFLVGKDIEKYSFRVVEPSQVFETVSAQGCKQIIQYYFSPKLAESEKNKILDCKETIKLNAEDLFIKPKFDLNEQNNIVSKLFEMEIPIYLDDISGSLKIGYLTLK